MKTPREYIEEISKTICWPDPDDFLGGDEEENAEAIQSIINVYVNAVETRDKEWLEKLNELSLSLDGYKYTEDMIK